MISRSSPPPTDAAEASQASGEEPLRQPTLGELARVFGRLGLLGFGGPAAHVAMMEEEVVERRRWLPQSAFLDLLGATNLIPGPNSTEMAILIGRRCCGWPGLLVAGACFILPAALVTGTLAWAYVRYGGLPATNQFLYGTKPAVVAIIGSAIWRLGRTAIRGWQLALIGLAVAALSLAGANQVLALFGGGLAGMLWLRTRGSTQPPAIDGAGRSLPGRCAGAAAGTAAIAAAPASSAFPLWKLGLVFLKVGAVLYGSGYVLVAFLDGDLVRHYHLLSHQQLLDAVAVGQITPGPVLSTATFIGYVIAGPRGAIVATLAIFAPSFAIVAALQPLVARLRQSSWTSAFLDAINASALALMVAVALKLAAATLTHWPAWAIAAGAAVAAIGLRVNAVWIVLGGAVVGYGLSAWAGV
jgi:chromate transporter